MKDKLLRVREHSAEIERTFSANIIYEGLMPCFLMYDRKVRVFKLTHAEIFYGCMCVIDSIRKEKDSEVGQKLMWEGELTQAYTDLAPVRASKQSIQTAVEVVLDCVDECLDARKASTSWLPRFFKMISDLELSISMEGSITVGLVSTPTKELTSKQYWRFVFAPYVKEYMAGDLYLSDEVDLFLDQLNGKRLNETPILFESPKRLLPDSSVIGHPQPDMMEMPYDEEADEDEEDDDIQLTNRQLIILFEELLDVTLIPGETNISAFAELVSRVSGRSKGSIRNKIPSGGIDYADKSVTKDLELVASLVEKVSPEMARKLRENL